MELDKDGINCNKCGYFVKQSQITSAYINGLITLPIGNNKYPKIRNVKS